MMADTTLQAHFPPIGPYPSQIDDASLLALIHCYCRPPRNGIACTDRPASDTALQVLVLVLHHAGHLNDALLERIRRLCGLALPELRALRSFYSFLDQQVPCRYRILVSTNIIDEYQGAQKSLEYLQQHFRLQPDVVIKPTSCTGFSDLAPGALINGIPITRFTPERARQVAALIDSGHPFAQWPAELFDYQTRVYQKDILLNLALPPGAAITAARQLAPAAVIEGLRLAGLRGRGGAGFPTWQKWSTAAAINAKQKYVVCNADEGEPGTFKDRILLAQHFDAVIEGMLICAHAVGANAGVIYLRGEYAWLRDALQARVEIYRRAGLLTIASAANQHSNFDFQIHLGAGAYVCGEESALLESLEGKRGIPRIRPPFPAQQGYQGAPTVVNNVETFCAVSWIALHSPQAFAALGNPSSTGTKLHSVAGDCAKPGIYELPLGVSVATLLSLCDAKDTFAVQVGGPSGRLLFEDQFNTPIDFSHVSSGGSFMVFSRHRRALDILRNFARFFAHESCGFCTPCRAGTQTIAKILDQIHDGVCPPQAERDLRELADLLRITSHCGLGQTAASALTDVMTHYPQALATPAGLPASAVFLRTQTP